MEASRSQNASSSSLVTDISVIVPTHNSAATLDACLRSIRDQRDARVELIVVDNDSTDDTIAIARRYADRVLEHGPERSAQRNYGVTAASAEAVMFVDSDMVLDDAVAVQARDALAERRCDAAIIPEVAFGEGFWAACRALEKRLYLHNAHVEAPRAFRRDVFLDLGGFDEGLTGGEDWELPDRLSRSGYKIGRIDAFTKHDEGRLTLSTAFAKKRYYGAGMPRYLHASGGRGLLRLLRPGAIATRTLWRQPKLACGLLLLKGVEAIGLLLGAVDHLLRRDK